MCPDLLYRLNNKEELAFKEVFNTYYPIILGWALNKYQLLISRQDIEDISSEAFMGLYNKRGELYKPLSYLFRAVENKTKILVKSNQCRLKRQYYYSSNEDKYSETTYSISLEDFKALYLLIETLPPRGKLVLKMYLKGIRGQEIADKLKMQPSTVRSQTQHVFKLLKNKMDNHSHIKTK